MSSIRPSAADVDDTLFSFPVASGLADSTKASSPISQAAIDQAYTQAYKLWPEITKQAVRNALNSKFAEGDPGRAVTLLQFFRDAVAGYVTPVYSKRGQTMPLRGASNYHGVSCYMDSLLVAMFSRMGNFEPLLNPQRYNDEETNILAVWLRLFVNLLRNGELVTSDIVQGLMAAAVNAGWARESAKAPLQQQDAAEFFAFITEKLNMPLLALRVDIAHAGKGDEDDHKLIKEQLLYLPVPGVASDPPILLEECLEIYFSNAVSVSRHLDAPQGQGGSVFFRDNFRDGIAGVTPSSRITSSPSRYSRRRSYSIISVTTPSIMSSRRFTSGHGIPHDDDAWSFSTPPVDEGGSENDGLIFEEPETHADSPSAMTSPGASAEETSTQSSSQVTPAAGFSGDVPEAGSLPSYNQLFGPRLNAQDEASARDIKNSLWTSDNEITLPAWMFLQLMPFYADSSSITKSSPLNNLGADEVARHFGKTRPVLGLVLKRYYWDSNGHSQRNSRRVIVPETISLPSFVADDSDRKQAFGNFKLVLEAAIFHTGTSVNSGHYLALISDLPPTRKLSSATATTVSSEKRFSWLRGNAGSSSGSSSSIISNNPSLSTAAAAVLNASSTVASSQNLPPLGTSSIEETEDGERGGRQWWLVDDMAPAGEKLQPVCFSEVFKEQCPYMLFYRMVALDDDESEDLNDKYTKMEATQTDLSQTEAPHQVKPITSVPADRSGKKKKRPKFLRRHHKDYASTYREEKCIVM